MCFDAGEELALLHELHHLEPLLDVAAGERVRLGQLGQRRGELVEPVEVAREAVPLREGSGLEAEQAPAPSESSVAPAKVDRPAVVSPRSGRAFMPTSPGSRSTYVFVQERSRAIAGRDTEIEELRGTRIDEIAPHDGDQGRDVVRVDSQLHARGAGGEIRESRSHYYRVDDDRIELLGERYSDPTSALDLSTRYEVPLSILEASAEPGQRWEVGVRSRRDLHTRLDGEVLGIQDVDTPAGHFESCLVIRLTGETSGVLEAYGTRMEVPSGDVTLTRWYAPGHGLVLAKEERNQVVVLEDGTQIEYSERTRFALRSAETSIPARAGSVIAPAAPADSAPGMAP